MNIGQPASLYQSPRRQIATSNQVSRKYNNTMIKNDTILQGNSFLSSSLQNSYMEESTRISASRPNDRRSPLDTSENRFLLQNSVDFKKADNLMFQPTESDVWPPLDQVNVLLADSRKKDYQQFVPQLNIKAFKPRPHDLSQSIQLPGLTDLQHNKY